jgi:GNAT superfamily N-acetyltransferase
VSESASLRKAVLEDAAAIACVQVETWRAAYRGTVPDAFLDEIDLDERAERWRQGFAGQPAAPTTWVAEEDGEVVGFVAFGRCRDDDVARAVGELYAIYVLADRWRSGIGRALHDVCTAELRRAGFTAATLWTLDANPAAKAFYEALGWQADGTSAMRDFAGADLAVVRYQRPL